MWAGTDRIRKYWSLIGCLLVLVGSWLWGEGDRRFDVIEDSEDVILMRYLIFNSF